MPSLMLAFTGGFLRRSCEPGLPVNLFERQIFKNPKNGLVPEQQSNGVGTKRHDVLTLNDIELIFNSEFCDLSNSESFRNRLLLAVGLAIGARTTELRMLCVEQFKYENFKGVRALVSYPEVDSRKGESKNHCGGLKFAAYRPRRIPKLIVPLLNGTQNVFSLIHEYFEARKRQNLAHDPLFLSFNRGNKNDIARYFKAQPISINKMFAIVKEVCSALGIRAKSVSKHFTTHSLRATMLSKLISAWFSDAAVVLRAGHRDTTILQSSHILIGCKGEAQLTAVLADCNECQLEIEPSRLVRTYESGTISQRGEAGMNDGILAEFNPSSPKRICLVRDSEAKERDFEFFGWNLEATNYTINVTLNNIERSY